MDEIVDVIGDGVLICKRCHARFLKRDNIGRWLCTQPPGVRADHIEMPYVRLGYGAQGDVALMPRNPDAMFRENEAIQIPKNSLHLISPPLKEATADMLHAPGNVMEASRYARYWRYDQEAAFLIRNSEPV